MQGRFSKEYSRLNPRQKQAVDLIDGPMLVLAGPGTGKTQLLSMKVANTLRVTDIDSGNILCLTFTEAAAFNMRERLLGLIGPQAHKVGVFTFHSFGAYVIQNYPEYFYDAPLVEPIDTIREYEILSHILDELPHSNPFSKKLGETFFHSSSLIRTISWAKQAGLSPEDLRSKTKENFRILEKANLLLGDTFVKTPAKNMLGDYTKLAIKLQDLSKSTQNQLIAQAAKELADAISEIKPSSGRLTPVTGWRNRWLTQIKPGHWQFSDTGPSRLLLRFCDVYEKYQDQLTSMGLYSFDDMILRTNQAILQNDELRLDLQEQYQYILVDEYQDTNGAQNRLLYSLVDNPVNEGRPNLTVVGDDDQAIYRFQGADSSVLGDLIERFKSVEVVILERSYRSGQGLLDLAGQIISKASGRLNKQLEANKQLSSVAGTDTKIKLLQTQNESNLYYHLAKLIKKTIAEGTSPSQIAVLAPKHAYLEAFVPYLLGQGIDINYERRERVLEQPRIVELLDLIELVSSLAKAQIHSVNTILPKVLAADYINLSPQEWFGLALSARENQLGWLGLISDHDNPKLANLSAALKTIAKASQNQPFEYTFYQLVGLAPVRIGVNTPWYSPWRDYYFSDQKIKNDPEAYLKFIGQFNILLARFHSYRPSASASLEDFKHFIELYKQSDSPLLYSGPEIDTSSAISVQTVYKAKGLEWDVVILLNCLDDIWGPKTRVRHQSFRLPSYLRWIEPAGASAEDLIKLFYVGLTRSKKKLYLTSYDLKANGQPAERLRYLDEINENLPKPKRLANLDTPALVAEQRDRISQLINRRSNGINDLLQPRLESYRLSATHLNDFLSIDRGGPEHFFRRHLLQIPELVNPMTMYGNAVHRTLEYAHRQFQLTNRLPSLSLLREHFTEGLASYPLPAAEMSRLRGRGTEHLGDWITKHKTDFKPTDLAEHNFLHEGAVLGEARLTGAIDVLRQSNNRELQVIDYKTSRPLYRWQGSNQSQAMSGYSYLRQLYFYKILVEHSRSFSKKFTVSSGQIDFITPEEDTGKFISLTADLSKDGAEKLIILINQVWRHIIKLEMPDISNYPKTLAGIKAFETDLIEGRT